MAPRTRSYHMNQKRSWPGVPNRYRTRSRPSDTRPKSMATVVDRLLGMASRSSTPTLASVITASVVRGTISETAPTKVVLPTPKPPPTTIFTDVIAWPALFGSKPTESTQNPFHQHEVRFVVADGGGPVHDDQAQLGHVAQQHLGHAERHRQQGGDLGDRPRLGTQTRDGAVLGLSQCLDALAVLARGHHRLDLEVHGGLRAPTGPRVGADDRRVGEILVRRTRRGHARRRERTRPRPVRPRIGLLVMTCVLFLVPLVLPATQRTPVEPPGETVLVSHADVPTMFPAAPWSCARSSGVRICPTRSTSRVISYATCPMSHSGEASTAREDPSLMAISSMMPPSISTIVSLTPPASKQRAAPCVRLMRPDATADSWSARSTGSRADAASSSPSADTTTACATPVTRSVKSSTNQPN